MAVCQIREREERQEETKSETDSGKRADLETGKTQTHGGPGRFGTLGRGPIKMAGNLHLPKDFSKARLSHMRYAGGITGYLEGLNQ